MEKVHALLDHHQMRRRVRTLLNPAQGFLAQFLFAVVQTRDVFWRSEEHTSELQSLMRISYAVFCLKKKNNTTTLIIIKHNTTNDNPAYLMLRIHHHNYKY